MRIPYTYRIGWSKLNKFYYGAQYGKLANPQNLWKTYFTSSKLVKKFRENNGEPDIIEIRKTFKNEIDCKNWENKILSKVIKNPNYLNISANFKGGMVCITGLVTVFDGEKYFLTPKDHPDYLSGKFKHVMSGKVVVKDNNGKKFAVSVNDFRYISGELMSINKGRQPPKQTGKIWVTNNIKNRLISPQELDIYMGKGFVRGKRQKHPKRDYSDYIRIKSKK